MCCGELGAALRAVCSIELLGAGPLLEQFTASSSCAHRVKLGVHSNIFH
jgi:hypothetical protein